MSATDIDQERLLSTSDAQVWAEEFQKLVRRGVEIDEGLMIGWFANAMAVAERETHERFVEVLRYIARLCSHEELGDFAEDHVHEPSTGGQPYCGPCHAWRVLNGSPSEVTP